MNGQMALSAHPSYTKDNCNWQSTVVHMSHISLNAKKTTSRDGFSLILAAKQKIPPLESWRGNLKMVSETVH